ncbi:MAG: pepsin/retropepsin-like aspartic protease family protein [Bacteroidia bacterium]|nr:pepsin/retropepsin-like aspartic protease family protein [Bacteroidia bacterium]
MQSDWIKNRLFLLTFLATATVFLASFSTISKESAYSKSSYIPIPGSLIFYQTNTYTPEFNINADSVVIPLKRAGRLFLIEAKVEDETGNLVFDTGANGLVLNSTYFRNHVKSGGTTSTGVTGSVGTVEQISISKILIADLTYKNLRADIANLGHIENRRGIKILGLIGFSMFRNLEIIIDPKNNELKLFRIDRIGKKLNNRLADFKADHIQSIEGNTNILFLKGKINGKILNFCFDTGAETNAICSDCNRSIMNTLTITRRSGLSGAGSANSEVLFGRMNDFTIGNKQIPNMETIITNLDALSEAYGTRIDGMLGYNFLEQGIVCVNFVKKQFGIRFTKREEK